MFQFQLFYRRKTQFFLNQSLMQTEVSKNSKQKENGSDHRLAEISICYQNQVFQ